MNALQQFEFDEIDEITSEQRFTIENIDGVNWALRKLSAIQSKTIEVQQLADTEIERISDWAKSEKDKLQQSVEYFEGLLSEYAMKQRIADDDYKKTSTPYGTVKFKKNHDKWTYEEEKLVQSLKENNLTELIRVKEEPNKAQLKKVASVFNGQVVEKSTGIVLEGVSVVPQPESIVVEVAK